MKLSLLITGQIRNADEFRALVREIDCVKNRFQRIVFSSWSDHIRLAQHLIFDENIESYIEFCDCGQLVPIVDTLHGRFKSFLAQHQQLALGLDILDDSSHVLRVRADFKSQVTGHFRQLIDILDAAWPPNASKCLILGAGGFVPCFIEDRILMLTPHAAEKLKNMPMAKLYNNDHYNIYPEYLIYSTILDWRSSGLQFLKHDHRFGNGPFHISEYDKVVFGNNYEFIVKEYIDRFENSFAFLGDAAAEVGIQALYSEMGLYAGYDSRDMATFKDRWQHKIREFYNGSITIDEFHDMHENHGFRGVEAEKQTLNMFKNEYMCQRYSNVVEWSGLGIDSIFYYEYLELLGCSLFLLGHADRARAVLEDVVDSDKAGLECYFYLVMILASAGDYVKLEKISRACLEKFPNEARVVEHIEGVWKSIGRTPSSDLPFPSANA